MARRHARFVGAAALGLLLLSRPGGAGGDEPAKVNLAPAVRWKAGDAVTRTETLDFSSKNHHWATGGSAGDDDFAFRCEAAWVERCTEADAEGRPTALQTYR